MLRTLCLFSWLLFIPLCYANSFSANPNGGVLTSKLTMVLKSSCSASVNDVSFGNIVAGQIPAVAQKTISLTVACDSIMANYTLKVTPQHGVHNASIGTIASNNSSIVYQLRWASATFAATNSYVSFNTILSPAIKPTTTSFTIPIYVKPVKRVATTIAGPANTSLNLTLAFN